jgi:hypothetical protein
MIKCTYDDLLRYIFFNRITKIDESIGIQMSAVLVRGVEYKKHFFSFLYQEETVNIKCYLLPTSDTCTTPPLSRVLSHGGCIYKKEMLGTKLSCRDFSWHNFRKPREKLDEFILC